MAAFVRRHDPDRFLTALFAPAARRPALLLLFALNHELARAAEVASEPVMALIRLQWWREVVEGAARPHPVATPLREAVAGGALAAADLLALIEAREAEVGADFPDRGAFRAWLEAGAGGVAVAAARALGTGEPEGARAAGAAYGLAGTLRTARLRAAQGRCLLPADALAEAGLGAEAVVADPAVPALDAVLARLAAEGRAALPAPRRWGRAAVAAALPLVLARRDLARPTAAPGPRGLADRLAVVRAGLSGRV
jgi:phytoene synthase